MANWMKTMRVADIFNSDNSVAEKGKQMAKRIRVTFKNELDFEHDDYEMSLEEIVERFENITGYDDVSPVEEFDQVMEEFYDFCDESVIVRSVYGKRCWVHPL